MSDVIGYAVIGLGRAGWDIHVAMLRGRKDAKIVRDQVENEHQDAPQPNLREDLDAKEKAAEARDKQRKKQLDDIAHVVKQTATDVALLKAGYQANRDDIDDLMDTAAEERRQKALWGPPPQTRRERRSRNND